MTQPYPRHNLTLQPPTQLRFAGDGFAFVNPRRAAFWALLALIAYGGFFALHDIWLGSRVVPVTVAWALVVWAVYGALFWLVLRWFGLPASQPASACLLALAWGGLGAARLAPPANSAIQSLCAKLVSPEFAAVWGPAIAGPITEEFLKLAGVILLVLLARKRFETVLSVLILGALSGLGFQVVENFIYTVRAAASFPLERQAAPVFINLLTRGFMSGLWSHAAYTTVASYGVAWFVLHPQRTLAMRTAHATLWFALAWALHFFWNSPWLEDSFATLGDGYLSLAVLLAVKGMPALVAAILLWQVAVRESPAC